ncbi:MAG: N-acetyltransferase [Litoreibacter sp.]|uniref:GNAT family N-acetyltransferase n=1 Tax=Litoreibacter sp. TaxID=1969459 RepID=UPI00329A2BA5
MELRQENSQDWWDVEALYDLSFAPGRTALSSYRLRDGIDPVPELSLVASDETGIIGGAIRYWPICVSGHKALLLGPIAVHPTRQGEGVGGALMRDSLARAEGLGWARVLLVGDLPYYGKFGFKPLQGVIMPPPTNPSRVLGFGDWDGVRGDVTSLKKTGSDTI